MTPPEKNPPEYQAKKRFGQNFLVDENIIRNIINGIAPKNSDHLVEIGPGLGALTKHLVGQCKKLDVVEIDRVLAERLEQQFGDSTGFQLHCSDALKTDFSHFTETEQALRIIGNLPYNISTPILFHLLNFKHYIHDMHFMLQKEVVDRMASPPGQKSYGRLSVMVQYHCHVEPLFTVPPSAFKPAPKVESAIVRLRPRNRSTPVTDPDLFAKIVNLCFQQRRKTLRNGLKILLKDFPDNCIDHFDLSRRPGTFSVEEFIALSNQLGDANSAKSNGNPLDPQE